MSPNASPPIPLAKEPGPGPLGRAQGAGPNWLGPLGRDQCVGCRWSRLKLDSRMGVMRNEGESLVLPRNNKQGRAHRALYTNRRVTLHDRRVRSLLTYPEWYLHCIVEVICILCFSRLQPYTSLQIPSYTLAIGITCCFVFPQIPIANSSPLPPVLSPD